MSNPALDAVVRLLREENKYDTLPSKAVNKLLYLVHKATNRRDLDLTVPYFWYMFGTVASDAGNDGKSDKGPRRLSNTTNNHKNQREIDQLRSVVRDVLDLYYEHSLEYITDITYRDAPYSVQPRWRELDKKLSTRHDDHKNFFEVPPSIDEIRGSVDAVYDTFPVSRYPIHQSDLLDWYSIMTREIYSTEPDFDRMMNANLSFWRVFSLTIAENHRHAMSKTEVLEALDIDSFDAERKSSRTDLRQIETEAIEARFDDDENPAIDIEAADALAESALSEYLVGIE